MNRNETKSKEISPKKEIKNTQKNSEIDTKSKPSHQKAIPRKYKDANQIVKKIQALFKSFTIISRWKFLIDQKRAKRKKANEELLWKKDDQICGHYLRVEVINFKRCAAA